MLKQKLQTHKHVCMMCHSTIPLFGKAYVDLDPELSMENVVLLKTSPRTCHHWKYCSSLSKPHCWSLLGSNKCRFERLCDHVCVLIGPFFFYCLSPNILTPILLSGPLCIPFLSSWSMLEKERASWTWVWPRPASHSPPAATTMNWRSLMLGRSATSRWAWQEGWAF